MRLLLTSIFICISFSQDYPALGSSTSIDILTWNVQNYPKHSQTNNYISEIIYQTEVDVIAFQEIENQGSFNSLINSLPGDWVGYRAGNSQYGELAYAINMNEVDVGSIYTILNSEEYFFAYRPPYVLELTYGSRDYVLINNHFKCCGDGDLDLGDDWDEEYRRLVSSQLLKEYIDQNYNDDYVIVLGDLNDEISDNPSDNVFVDFLESDSFQFADYDIAYGPSSNWSYPTWPSHIDHIIISDELFSDFTDDNIHTFVVDSYMSGGWNSYDYYISDHRPVFIRFFADDFTVGDMNNDQSIDILDVIVLVSLVLSGDFAVEGDINTDGVLNVIDVVSLVNQILN